MIEILIDAIMDAGLDTIKLIPFLFITYLIMEFIETKMSEKIENKVAKAGKFGPLIGGILGIVPQCGFSVSACSLFASRIITVGTLVAVFLSTSDEMLPILISQSVNPVIIATILGIKAVSAVIVGFTIDLFFKKIFNKKFKADSIEEFCEQEHCHCDEKDNIFKSALIHTLKIAMYILIFSFLLNVLLIAGGEELLNNVFINNSILGPIVVGIVGLIPNCASSVIITQMLLDNVISFGTAMAGLLVSAGVGYAVLFRVNKNIKENLAIVGITYVVGTIIGIVINLLNISII